MNLTSFLGWRLKPKIWTGHPLDSDFSTYNIPSEPQDTARQSFFYFCCLTKMGSTTRRRVNRHRVILVNSGLGVPSQALIYPFLLYSCYYYFNQSNWRGVVYISCCCQETQPCFLLLRVNFQSSCFWRYDVFHASLTSGYFGWGCCISSLPATLQQPSSNCTAAFQ